VACRPPGSVSAGHLHTAPGGRVKARVVSERGREIVEIQSAVTLRQSAKRATAALYCPAHKGISGIAETGREVKIRR
jgi:hypothetical protein